MDMCEINVSEEYIEHLCEHMLEWVQKPDAFTTSQFFQEVGIGYPYFKYFCHVFPSVNNTFDVMKSILCNRWIHFAMNNDEVPSHQVKLLTRFVRLYDSYGLDVEEGMRHRVAEAERTATFNYLSEKYDKQPLHRDYQKIYEENDNKRRGPEEA